VRVRHEGACRVQQAERRRAQVAVAVVGAREGRHHGLDEVAAQDGAVQRDRAQQRPHLVRVGARARARARAGARARARARARAAAAPRRAAAPTPVALR